MPDSEEASLTRVKWDDEEKERINAAARSILASGARPTRLGLLAAAQESAGLAAARRRSVHKHVGVEWFVPEYFADRSLAAPPADPTPAKEEHASAKPGSRRPWSTTPKDGRPLVRWTRAERAGYIRGAAALYLAGGYRSMATAMAAFNATLPEGRRSRTKFSASGAPWIEEMMTPILVELRLEKAQDKQLRGGGGIVQQDLPSTATSLTPLRQQLAELEAKIAAQQGETEDQTDHAAALRSEADEPPVRAAAANDETPTATPAGPTSAPTPALTGHAALDFAPRISQALGGLRQFLVEELASIIADSIALAIGRQFAKPQTDALSATTPADDPVLGPIPAFFRPPTNGSRPPPKPRLPSVLVVGLRSTQAQVMTVEFGAVLDLRFYTEDESKDLLRKKAAAAEVTVASTDGITHSTTDICKARCPRVILAAGGIAAVRSALNNLVIADRAEREGAVRSQTQIPH